MAYDVSEVGEFDVEFRHPRTRALVDPATVQLKITPPVAAQFTLTYPSSELVRLELGRFSARVLFTEPGSWVLRWITTGTHQGVHKLVRQVTA